MIKKYNLALIPETKSKDVGKLTQQFSDLADRYLLGKNSLPHVTLHHFEAEENKIDSIWQNVCQSWQEKPLHLEFKKFCCSSFDNEIYWIILLPHEVDILFNMHHLIAKSNNFPIKESFEPHMTLLNTKNKNCEIEVKKILDSSLPWMDTFVLALGKSDAVWQLTEIIYQF